jgi:hypothetical protein
VVPPSAWWIGPGMALATQRPSEYHAVAQGVKRVFELTTRPTDICLLHIGREPGLELAHQWAEARHDGDRLEQRP